MDNYLNYWLVLDTCCSTAGYSLEENMLYYVFSTSAQVIAALLAFIAIFVLEKSKDYRINMQREVANLTNKFKEIIEDLEDSHRKIDLKKFRVWHAQMSKSDSLGAINEMRGIFLNIANDFKNFINSEEKKAYTSKFGIEYWCKNITDIQYFCINGMNNYKRRMAFLDNFKMITACGLLLIFGNIIAILFAKSKTCIQFYVITVSVLCSFVYIIFVYRFVSSHIKGTEDIA